MQHIDKDAGIGLIKSSWFLAQEKSFIHTHNRQLYTDVLAAAAEYRCSKCLWSILHSR